MIATDMLGKIPNNSHGLIFESNLLTLYNARGLDAGCKFEITKEREDMGGKLDDVIFRYEVADDTSAGKHWRYRFLQAKHKINEKEKIAADHLLVYNPKGDFSLPKYFHSFLNITARGEDIHDCIICTNIGFHLDSLAKRGVELVSIDDQPEDILKFGAPTARYKLEVNNAEFHRKLREEWSPVRMLAKELKDCAEEKKTTDIRKGTILNSYHVALVDEHVIDCKTQKFHQDFLSGAVNLSGGAKELRQTISALVKNDEWKEWKFKLNKNFGKSQSEVNNPLPKQVEEEDITDYFDKLIFVVDMPNEMQFEEIIEKEDISKYYRSDQCKMQTIRIFKEIPDAFLNKTANFWLTSEEGKKILLAGVTEVSLEYQKILKEKIGFKDTATRSAIQVLKKFMDSPGNNKVQRIFTPSPQFTAVKVLSAVQILMRELKQEGNYLAVPSGLLQHEEEMKRWRNIFKLQKGFHHFLVIVCDNEDSTKNLENLFVGHLGDTNFGIIISRGEELDEEKEEIKYTDLTENFQNQILSKNVSLFQEEEKTLTVRDLVGDKPEEVIDFRSIQELLSEEKEIKIPSFNTLNFELYIKRRLRFPLDDQFELDGKCKISPDGHIEWFVEEKERSGVWKKIKDEITNRASSTQKVVEDSDLIKEKSIVIISEVAGSGKSTILSHLYNEIKKMKPDHWVIRINLLDRCEEFMELDKVENLEDAADFLVDQLNVVDEKSSFSRSLLRNRLETGDRIVVMFDGFDEINSSCQEKTIQLMKAITKEKRIQFYVTTRPHMLDILRFELSQLAYSLDNFTEKDQIEFLVSYWKKELNLSEEYILLQFAASLVKRVSQALNDQEKTFFGIPLQSQILALNFQSNVSELIKTGWTEQEEELLREEISDLLAKQKFDCVSLFERLMKKKSRIFLDKAKATDNDIQKSAIEWKIKAIEDHLTRLAIETIVTDQKITKVFAPFLRQPQSLLWSDEELANEEKDTAVNGLKFGLTIKIGDKIQFLHRTYAEYLFALFLYKGFHLDDKRHNKLLENEFIPELILEKILVKEEYEVVQVFFNGMFKKIVDDDEKWRNVNTRCLPDRFKHFITCFCNLLKTENNHRNALLLSLETAKIKFFTFICDCLDSTLDETQMETVMMECFILNHLNRFSFKYFRTTESKVFERFIGYFKNNTWKVLLKLDPFYFQRFNLSYFLDKDSEDFPQSPLENNKYIFWNQEEHNKTVGILVKLIEKELSRKDNIPLESDMFPLLRNVLIFLIFHENCENHLNKFIRLLSRTTDASKFAKLIKESFNLKKKKKIISGRIEKALAIIRDLKKNELLSEMRCMMFKIEPEAFQRFYFPVVQDEEVTAAMDVNMLMEPDSYGMTCLHRAAFYGDTKEVGKIFENLSKYQEKKTKQVMAEFMIRDNDGFTPFYIATVRGHEEMYSRILTFLKQNLPSCIKHLACRYRFELRSLHDAIESENIEMFQMILKAIKKELGTLEFVQVLCRPKEFCFEIYRDENRGVKSIFELIKDRSCKKEFFNAIVKIAVMRDDGVKKDYSDLYDLIFQDNEVRKILRQIDAEDLQGLLSIKGVTHFTKQFLNYTNSSGDVWENLIDPLMHFTKDQLEQFLDTITSKFENKIAIDEEDFSKIFNSLKKREVGDDSLKKLLLYEDEKGLMMIRLPIEKVKDMLTCLSVERQEDVKQEWKNNAPPMRTFFLSTYLEPLEYCMKEILTNNLMFYLEFGSKEILTEFVEIVTDLRMVDEGRCSVLSFIFERCGKHTIYKILKLVSEKEEQGILGSDAVKTMMIHKINKIPLIIKAMLLGEDIDDWLEILSPKIREEIQGFMKLHAPKFIDQAFSKRQTLFFDKSIQTLISFIHYSNEKQLNNFVKNVTFIPYAFPGLWFLRRPQRKTSSIWEVVIEQGFWLSEIKMGKLMKIVSEKLGSNAVKELILHKYNEKATIFYFLEGRKEKLLESMLKYLSAEDRIETQRQIDEFLAYRKGNCPCLF